MPIILHRSKALSVKISYAWQKHKKGPYYYRRRKPKDVRHLYGDPKKEFEVESLDTYSDTEAARLIGIINKKWEIYWEQLRNGVGIGGAREDAEEFLRRFNLTPEPMADQDSPFADVGYERLIESLEAKVPDDAQSIQPHVTPYELRALAILQGKEAFTLSDAKQVYLKRRDALRKTPTTRKLINETDASFDLALDQIGDKEITKVKRREVAGVIESALRDGLKTATIKKRLGLVRAAINDLIDEFEVRDEYNPFKGFKIPNLGDDREERSSLSREQVKRIRSLVDQSDSDTTNIIGMLLDTGARIGEIAGLLRDDVALDAETPHIIIHRNPFRRLKTKASQRKVPLVGHALIAARRACANAGSSQWMFERYIGEDKVKNDNASAAVKKALGRIECETAHWLRHTMNTRLKNKDIAKEKREEVQGWERSGASMADTYGDQTALRLMREWLESSLAEDAL